MEKVIGLMLLLLPLASRAQYIEVSRFNYNKERIYTTYYISADYINLQRVVDTSKLEDRLNKEIAIVCDSDYKKIEKFLISKHPSINEPLKNSPYQIVKADKNGKISGYNLSVSATYDLFEEMKIFVNKNISGPGNLQLNKIIDYFLCE
ncbi:hypothetical protein [Taibaiella koreensis]|uniref:hypothetical protein n=1 Tax=Taibaiella koreensis TaxID=1268548 RepID=UPI000E5991CE|nr:hypothetical protein [Taibaiella koreensis]